MEAYLLFSLYQFIIITSWPDRKQIYCINIRWLFSSIVKEAATNDCVFYCFIYVYLIIIIIFLSKPVVMQIEKAESFLLLALWLKSVVYLLASWPLDELTSCCLLGYKIKSWLVLAFLAQEVTSLLVC